MGEPKTIDRFVDQTEEAILCRRLRQRPLAAALAIGLLFGACSTSDQQSTFERPTTSTTSTTALAQADPAPNRADSLFPTGWIDSTLDDLDVDRAVPQCLFDHSPIERSAASRALDDSLPRATVLSMDFELDEIDYGELDRSDIERAAGLEVEYLSGADHLSISADPEDPNDHRLYQQYVPSERGSPVVEFPISQIPRAEELWLSYSVRFEPEWEFVRGGKLPGLAGGTHPTGLVGADGTDGFSARLAFEADGHLAAYVYHPDRPNRGGEVFDLCGTFFAGQELHLTQRVIMNTGPENFDGSIEVWVDGSKRLEKSGLRLRTSGDFGVDVFLFSSFYGGSTEEWAPSTTTTASFDRFLVGASAESVQANLG